MKNFISLNWYKLLIGTSLLLASFGFLIRSVSPAFAYNSTGNADTPANYRLVPINSDGSINVKLSDEQLNKIIPKNEDGSINAKITADEAVEVNVIELRGKPVMTMSDGVSRGLIVGSCKGTYNCD